MIGDGGLEDGMMLVSHSPRCVVRIGIMPRGIGGS